MGLAAASGDKGNHASAVSQIYEDQEKAILQELNNCLQVVSQMGRGQAEYIRFVLTSDFSLFIHHLQDASRGHFA